MSPCVTLPNSPALWPEDDYGKPGSTELGVIQRCVDVHERSEIADGGMKCKKGPDFQYRGTYPNEAEEKKADCRARKAQLACLREGLQDCNGDSTCEGIIQGRIDEDQKETDKKCGTDDDEWGEDEK